VGGVFATDYDLGSRRVVRPRGHDFELVLTPRFEHHFVQQCYEALTADLLVNILYGRTVFVDVGAHYGFFSLLCARRHPDLDVVALEPVFENRQLLQEGIERNGLTGSIEVVASAASDRMGTGRFFISEAADNCSFYPHPATSTLRTVQVDTVTLDSILEGRPGAATAVIKIDTDGHEMKTLEGLRETLDGDTDVRLIVELNPKMHRLAGHEPEDLLGELQRLGFETFLIDDPKRRYLRVRDPREWRGGCAEQGYANLYCVPRARALSVVLFAHSSGLCGAERSLLGNVTTFVQDQGAVCTVVLPPGGPLCERLARLGAATVEAELPWWSEVHPVPEDEVQARLERGRGHLWRDVLPEIARASPDVIETMTIVQPWGAVAAFALGTPHVWHVCEYAEAAHGICLFFPRERVLATIEGLSNVILTPTERLRHHLFPDLAARTAVIPRWFPPAPLLTPAPRAAERPRGQFRIGVFATLSEGKDQATAVRALAELVRRGYDARLLLAGHALPGCRDSLVALCSELDVVARVELPGFLDDPFRDMAGVDVVVSCSPQEAFERTLPEATFLGKPVALTSTSVMAPLFPEAALMFAPGDAFDLAHVLERLIIEPDLGATLNRRARALMADHFSRERSSAQRYQLFRGLRGAPNWALYDPAARFSQAMRRTIDLT
jgi:FkbM family methyltransferase